MASGGVVSIATIAVVVFSLAVAIASLVLNIVILTKVNSNNNYPVTTAPADTNTTPANSLTTQISTLPPTSHMVDVVSTTVAPPQSSLQTSPTPPVTAPSSTFNPNENNCPMPSPVSNSSAYRDAAAFLLSGLDETTSPCIDFYAFTCNTYLKNTNLTNGQTRLGTYLQSQIIVNTQTGDALKNVDVNNTAISATERITKAAWDACSKYYNSAAGFDRSGDVYSKIKDLFGDAPFLGGELKNGTNLFNAAGAIEQNNAVPNLMFSWATVDYKNVSQNALYISQPTLPMPLDFYIKPQFYDQLKKRVAGIAEMMTAFAQAVNKTVDPGDITKAATGVVDFEVQIAMASWSDDLLRNYIQQYNPYNLDGLNSAYGGIDWNQYLAQLFNGVADKNAYQNYNFVISQPPYFSWLSSIITGNLVDPNVIANYIIVNLLFDDGDFIGSSEMSRIIREYDYVPHVLRAGRGSRRVGRRYNRMLDNDGPEVFCFDIIMAYMPYGPGYVYVKSRGDARNTVSTNVQQQTDLIIESFLEMQSTLTWMDDQSKQAAITKSQNLVKNYGWPSWFGNFTSDPADFKAVDDYNKEYTAIITLYNHDPIKYFYDIMLNMKRTFEVQEAMKLLTMPADRSFFLLSPALVNAWYQPERNSITFPYAAWNPPYYSYDYPQAYNYAGQGGTGGHELTHGYDDEGVQFGPDGTLLDCDSTFKCGWMDDSSNDGFIDMAQCVVTQFNTQCCPVKTGNVHCANGATTQGENIADLGGQQAAYRAYRKYIQRYNGGQEEDRLPGLDNYTPNQVFWMTYGYSWCMKQTTESLVNQMLTNPHAPASCRTNQVMQDIPAFGQDFNCRRGDAMFPNGSDRCKVWVGY